MSDPTETARRVLELDATTHAPGKEVHRHRDELVAAAPELARALLESQAARDRALNLAARGSDMAKDAQAALAAANVEADRMREYVKGLLAESGRFAAERDALQAQVAVQGKALEDAERVEAEARDALLPVVMERDALRADLARVTAERDAARGQMAVERRQRERCEQEIAEAATLRESVRELVAVAREAREYVHYFSDEPERSAWHRASAETERRIDALLAKHAAPAPTPADAKETPAAVPGLVFGPVTDGLFGPIRYAIAGDGALYELDSEPGEPGVTWRMSDDYAEFGVEDTPKQAIAAATAHNAARLAKKGGE